MPIADLRRIVLDSHGLGVAGRIAANILVGRSILVPPGVTDRCRFHALDLAKGGLDAPEAAGGKRCRFGLDFLLALLSAAFGASAWKASFTMAAGLPSSNLSDAELMQYRRPVGSGPSSKTWPRCAGTRCRRPRPDSSRGWCRSPGRRSGCRSASKSSASRCRNRTWFPTEQRPAAADAAIHARLVAVPVPPVNAGSVPWRRVTLNCSGVSLSRHCSSLRESSFSPLRTSPSFRPAHRFAAHPPRARVGPP